MTAADTTDLGDAVMDKKVAVLIPCYNEAQTVARVVRDYKNALPEAEIYVYDNNSTDGTDAEAERAGAIVRYERRQGKGNVIRTMFRDIDADCYLMTDGDDTYPAENARELVEKIIDEHYDMAIGDRLSATYFTENDRRFHGAGNRVVRSLVNKFFHGHVTDIMTGYRAVSRTFAKSFPILSTGFEIETEMTIHALDKNFSIAAVPVKYRGRPEGSASKVNTVPDGIKVIFTIIKLFRDYKPLQFFSIIAAILLVVAFLLFVPILREFYLTGLVPRFPTLIASGFFAVFAIQALVCGLILDTQGKHQRQNFEIQMNILQEINDMREKQ